MDEQSGNKNAIPIPIPIPMANIYNDENDNEDTANNVPKTTLQNVADSGIVKFRVPFNLGISY